MKVFRPLLRLVTLCTVFVACASSSPKLSGGMTLERRENERACQEGNIHRCTALGRALLEDENQETNEPHGIVLLELACGADDNEACTALGKYYARNIKSTPRGKMLLERACVKHYANACVVLGDISNNVEEADPTKVISLYRNSCQQGSAEGCERLGIALYNNEFAGSKTDALAAFTTACRAGRTSSCHYLAMAKISRESELEEGLSLLEENCTKEVTASCTALANYWAPVVGKQPSCEKANPFAKKACKMSDVEGCVILSACLISDSKESEAQLSLLEKSCTRSAGLSCFFWANFQQSMSINVAETGRIREAYDKACRTTSIATGHACVRVAILDLKDKQSAIDTDQPFEFLRKACSADLAEACCFLSREYASGKRVNFDSIKATELATNACKLGYSACCDDTETSFF